MYKHYKTLFMADQILIISLLMVQTLYGRTFIAFLYQEICKREKIQNISQMPLVSPTIF